jgi:hypothetical protein
MSILDYGLQLLGVQEVVAGRDRKVLVFKDVVIKLPQSGSLINFVRGWYSNLKEVETIQDYTGVFREHIPVIRSTWFFGIIVVMEKYHEVKPDQEHSDRFKLHLKRLQEQEHPNDFFIWQGDNKVFNYGWNKHGQLVKFDLGTFF